MQATDRSITLETHLHSVKVEKCSFMQGMRDVAMTKLPKLQPCWDKERTAARVCGEWPVARKCCEFESQTVPGRIWCFRLCLQWYVRPLQIFVVWQFCQVMQQIVLHPDNHKFTLLLWKYPWEGASSLEVLPAKCAINFHNSNVTFKRTYFLKVLFLPYLEGVELVRVLSRIYDMIDWYCRAKTTSFSNLCLCCGVNSLIKSFLSRPVKRESKA